MRRDVRFGPIADSCSAIEESLFDHLIRECKNRREDAANVL